MEKSITPRNEYIKRIKNPKVKEMVNAQKPSITDPNGSYTGIPIFPQEEPEQDADDL